MRSLLLSQVDLETGLGEDVIGQNYVQVGMFNSVWFSIPLSPRPDYSWIRARRQRKLRINLG